MNEFMEILKKLMPNGAVFYENSASDGLSVSVHWKLNNDPNRPNKMSKTIAISLYKEATEDFSELPLHMQEQSLSQFKNLIAQKLSVFNPDHDSPRNTKEPVEAWSITSAEISG